MGLSVRVDVGSGMGGTASGAASGPMTTTGQGAFDFTAKQGELHLDTSGATAAGAPTSTDVVIDGSTGYVKVPDSALASTGGKHWASISTSAGASSGSPAGGSLDLGQLSQLSDPTFALELLQGFKGGTVTTVGRETLRGVDTTQYRITIDPAAGGPGGAASGLGALAGGAGTTGGAMPADVWVDAEGRMRKFSMTIDLSALLKGLAGDLGGLGGPGGVAGGASPIGNVAGDLHFSMTVGMELWDFGKPVTITLPDPADVVDGASVGGLDDSAVPAPLPT